MRSVRLLSVWTVLVLTLVCLLPLATNSSGSEGTRPVHYYLRCASDYSGPGPVDLEFHIWWDSSAIEYQLDFKEFELIFAPSDRLGYSGPNQLDCAFDENRHFRHTFQVSVPDNDTTHLELWFRGPSNGRMRIGPVYFVTTRDTAEFWVGRPRKTTRVEPDTTRYRVEMDLRDSVWLEGAKKYAERQGTKLVPSDSAGFYILRLPLNEVRALGGDGLNFRILDSLPPDDGSRASPHKWRTTPRGARKHERPGKNKEDRSDAEIYIDSVAGEDEWGRIYANQPVSLYCTYYNAVGQQILGVDNGYRVYSPDGLDWDTTLTARNPAYDWDSVFNVLNTISAKSLTGTGADSVRFLAFGDSYGGAGLADGFGDNVLRFTVGPIGSEGVGKTLCIDKAWVSGGTDNWMWSDSSGQSHIPDWGGPACFEVTEPGVHYVTGDIYYWDPTPATYGFQPARNIEVCLMDDDDVFEDDLIACTYTDYSGFYSFGPFTSWDFGGPDLYLAVTAFNSATLVTNEAADTFRVFSDTIDAQPGDHDIDIYMNQEQSKPFFVADAELDAWRKWQELRPQDNIPPVWTRLDKYDDLGAYYWSVGDTNVITVNDSVDSYYHWPATWNKSSLCHEYGHYISDTLDFLRAGGGAHELYGCYDEGLSSSEGWAQFFCVLALQTPVKVRYWNNFQDSDWVNLETGEYDLAPLYGSINARGLCNEGTVACILWDMYDAQNDDYSDTTDWGTLNYGPNPDGIGDTLQVPATDILASLCDPSRLIDCGEPGGCDHPDSLREFWDAWFLVEPHLGHSRAMVDIWYEHGHDHQVECCYQLAGDVDGGSFDTDISDLVYLVTYMFSGGPPPPCVVDGYFAETDMNGSGAGPDISDLVYTVSYMFSGGPNPMPCRRPQQKGSQMVLPVSAESSPSPASQAVASD